MTWHRPHPHLPFASEQNVWDEQTSRVWWSTGFSTLLVYHMFSGNFMEYRTDDLRIREIKELLPPAQVLRDITITSKAAETVYQTRQAIHRILHGADDRLLVILGPCSIHDVEAAKDYAGKLREVKGRLSSDLLVVMRVYFEKPRTTVGWKGLINDPQLDGSFRINEGLRIGRRLLLDLNEMAVPAGWAFLHMITPQDVAGLLSWGALGAPT